MSRPQPRGDSGFGRGRLRAGILAGVALATLGQTTVIAGILAPRLFLPGIVLLVLGLVVVAAIGAASPWLAPAAPETGPPAKTGA